MDKKKLIIWGIVVLAVIGAGVYGYIEYQHEQEMKHPKFYSGNGRLEATEYNISAKLAGRIDDILVEEGDYVTKGQILVKMQTNTLEAERLQAVAKKKQAEADLMRETVEIEVRRREMKVKEATLDEQKSKFDGSKREYERQEQLIKTNATTKQKFDHAETEFMAAKAAMLSAEADVKKAESEVQSAVAMKESAEASLKAAEADITRIDEDIKDSYLLAPRDGRVQYKIAEEGEVLSAGGRVLNMVDLSDVYMTFFLPESVAGKVPVGAEVFMIMDAFPETTIPASVTFVDSVAQFTPKTVETKVEREKLMFRVKAHVSPDLLRRCREYVKTGVPGVAWIRIDENTQWAASPISASVKKTEEEVAKQGLDLYQYFEKIKTKKDQALALENSAEAQIEKQRVLDYEKRIKDLEVKVLEAETAAKKSVVDVMKAKIELSQADSKEARKAAQEKLDKYTKVSEGLIMAADAAISTLDAEKMTEIVRKIAVISEKRMNTALENKGLAPAAPKAEAPKAETKDAAKK